MGKLLIVSISDHEEHIFNRVMAAIADEPDFDHIAPPQSSLSFSNLEILLKEHTVYCSGKLIPMTHHEFAVLTYLARHPGWVFSASQIYEAVWNSDGGRRKLTPDTPKGGYIRTILGSGYKFSSSPF